MRNEPLLAVFVRLGARPMYGTTKFGLPLIMQARREAACPRASRNFAIRPACRALIGSSLRFRARLIESARLRTSPLAMLLAIKATTSLMSLTET